MTKHTKRSATTIKAIMPTAVKPMLCTLLKKPFNDPDYVYEVKWDGYRIIAYKNHKHVRLDSRGGLDYTKKYPPLVSALKELKHDLILDGEAVVLNGEGKPDFDALQKFNGQNSGVVFYAFDILWLDGEDLTRRTLLERKQILQETLAGSHTLKYSEHFTDGIALYEQIQALGLEGIVAKNRNSQYIEDDRSKLWYKIPVEQKQEFVIGGWVESETSRYFRTLLFGAYQDNKLKWFGHAGGGYKERDMPAILKKLKAIETKKSPFVTQVDYEGIVHWVQPKLVANIKYSTLTKSGRIRKPAIFLGFRNDKQAEQVVLEPAHSPQNAKSETKLSTGNNAILKRSLPSTEDSNWPEVESEPISNQEEFMIDDCSITIYNVDKRLWKDIYKANLIQYYNSVSNYILPHLKQRPLSLHLKLKGPNAPGLYIKDMEHRQPACADIFTTPRKHKVYGKRDIIDYLVCNNLATLLYAINLGCIDLNPWTSTAGNAESPDFIIIDLDPTDEDFKKVIEVAKATHQVLTQSKLKSYIKTSGKTGLHIYIPCNNFSFGQARSIAENIASEVNTLIPALTTTEVSIQKRGNKVYIDPNQNDFADTVAAPYSVRPYKHPNVSTPIEWKELTTSLVPESFTMESIHKRLKRKGDLFMDVLDKKIATKNNKFLTKYL